MACVTCNGTGQAPAYRRVAEGTMQEHWERHGTGPCLDCLPRIASVTLPTGQVLVQPDPTKRPTLR